MKKLLFVIITLATAISCSGQKSIDRLFESYSDRDNFVTFHMGGNLLKFIVACDDDNDDGDRLPQEINEIRIIAQKDTEEKIPGFYNSVMRDLNLNDYEEFMRVKSSDENMIMLVKGDGKVFREFLMVSGGKNNVVIQIKGSLSYDEAKKLSENVKRDHGKSFMYD
jgi:hypothetical protein